MERIRFSVLRLLAEGKMAKDDIFALANTDWRDLFMAAGHGNKEEHKAWAKQADQQKNAPELPTGRKLKSMSLATTR